MSNLIFFNESLTPELIAQIGYKEQPTRGYYFLNQDEIEVEIIPYDEGLSSYKIEDPRVVWDPELHEINLIKDIEIPHPQFLFGEEGLVGEDDEIGLALRWFSRKSSVIDVKEVATISSGHDMLEYVIEERIEAGTLRGDMVLEVFMTDRKTGKTLGVLSKQTIIIDGNASLFPIQEVNYKGEPLWWVTLDYLDPLIDTFDLSSVSISLNFAHKHARHLKLEKGINSSPLLIEIIASALEIIVSDVMDNSEWNSIMNNESDVGSVGAIIYYFINTFEWDTSSRIALAKSIRADLDKRF